MSKYDTAKGRQMDRAKYQNELKQHIEEFIVADQVREKALQAAREAEGDKAKAAQLIRSLVPMRGEELIRALENPPYLCSDCTLPIGWYSDTCGPCGAKRKAREEEERIEARASELAAARAAESAS